MSYKNQKLNSRIMSDDESLYESDYLTSVLSMVNGYCKINLVVPQTSLFYSGDSLLPINAKVNDTTLNNNSHKNQVINTPESLTNVFKNIDLKVDENIDDKTFHSPNKTYVDELQVYSKPSYSDNSNLLVKTEENKSEPKGKKKKNKYNRVSSLDNQTLVPSTHKDQNCSNEYFNQFESDVLDDGHIKQEQELRNKQAKNIKNSISNNGHQSRSRTSPPRQNPENEITNENVSLQSQCPLCFGLYPTPDIEAHASECSI
ncbi:nuclear transcription factor Y subunit alpha [Acyrthosiphon pisum]|uniref:Uncharacterized protein n=1 Tax=Acyrthosiphon pisum TaxID=7029 RepID=J9K7X9_ACYPI|nr:nuclear transcription factor Y subunit alpha [Acyrthosiphon pisum]|eukprot:XP_003241683.1 PREDICTED: nuclear transcription factor Y subunit alpha [Acyrthosiphon pisum]